MSQEAGRFAGGAEHLKSLSPSIVECAGSRSIAEKDRDVLEDCRAGVLHFRGERGDTGPVGSDERERAGRNGDH